MIWQTQIILLLDQTSCSFKPWFYVFIDLWCSRFCWLMKVFNHRQALWKGSEACREHFHVCMRHLDKWLRLWKTALWSQNTFVERWQSSSIDDGEHVPPLFMVARQQRAPRFLLRSVHVKDEKFQKGVKVVYVFLMRRVRQASQDGRTWSAVLSGDQRSAEAQGPTPIHRTMDKEHLELQPQSF